MPGFLYQAIEAGREQDSGETGSACERERERKRECKRQSIAGNEE